MIPDDDLPLILAQLWRSVYGPVVLEALLTEQNWKHFAQAQDTPFTRDILGMISFRGMGPITESILDGTITVNGTVVQLTAKDTSNGHTQQSDRKIQKLEGNNVYVPDHKKTSQPLPMPAAISLFRKRR
jgi:hypothetical protein